MTDVSLAQCASASTSATYIILFPVRRLAAICSDDVVGLNLYIRPVWLASQAKEAVQS